MFTAFDVSTSGLVAQRVRLNAISSNIANMSTTRNEAGFSEAFQPASERPSKSELQPSSAAGAAGPVGAIIASASRAVRVRIGRAPWATLSCASMAWLPSGR